jgi:hypothetical protein
MKIYYSKIHQPNMDHINSIVSEVLDDVIRKIETTENRRLAIERYREKRPRIISRGIELERIEKEKKQKKAEYDKKRYDTNKAQIAEQQKKYRATENGAAIVKAASKRNDPKGNTSYAMYKNNANRRKKEFTITKEEFEWHKKQMCYLCGDNVPNIGIDRVFNGCGYIGGNVATCCWQCNHSKGRMTLKNYIKKCNKKNKKCILKVQQL